MMRKMLLTTSIVSFLWSLPAYPALYIWKDAQGSHHMVDRRDKLPMKYRLLLDNPRKASSDSEGMGFWVDESGNYHFYEKDDPVLPESNSSSGNPKTAASSGWRGKPNPVVLEIRVKDVAGPDSIVLEDGRILKYIGIAFPEQLKSNTSLYEESVEYQRKLLKGKTIHVLFDKSREDSKGRLLGFVFIGTDTFVNADLVMTGYAKVRTIPPNLEYRDLFVRLENFARTSQLGIWRDVGSGAMP